MLAGQSQIYAGRLELSKMRVARCELRLPNVEGLGSSMAYAYGLSMAYLCNSFVLSGIDFIFGMVLV